MHMWSGLLRNVWSGQGPASSPSCPASLILSFSPQGVNLYAYLGPTSLLPHRLNHPQRHLFHGKILFHRTGPWCHEGWGPLL